jgi:hypothetical protein
MRSAETSSSRTRYPKGRASGRQLSWRRSRRPSRWRSKLQRSLFNSHTRYDEAIRQKVKEGKSGEALFFELAMEDLRQAADLFRPIHDLTNGVDGWVSLEVSPLHR